jgi:hypothetical protein
MCQAGLAIITVGLAATAGYIDALIDSADDLTYTDFTRRASQSVTAAGSANTLDQAAFSQLGKQLFKI